VSWNAVMDPSEKRRRNKNLAMLGILVTLAVLLFVVTIVRLGMLE
jgi:hypothetical protein